MSVWVEFMTGFAMSGRVAVTALYDNPLISEFTFQPRLGHHGWKYLGRVSLPMIEGLPIICFVIHLPVYKNFSNMASSAVSNQAQIITNIAFGIAATTISIITVWQGHRAWRLWQEHCCRQQSTFPGPHPQDSTMLDDTHTAFRHRNWLRAFCSRNRET